MSGWQVVCLSLLLGALAVPAAASGRPAAAGEGSLVVQRGGAPAGVAAVTLVIRGTVVGRLSSGSPGALDTVVIDELAGNGDFSASAAADAPVQSTQVSPTRTRYIGSDFRFRAVDSGDFVVTIYGTGINIFAVGVGDASLQGMPDPTASGRYSLDGQPFQPLPAAASAWLQIR